MADLRSGPVTIATQLGGLRVMFSDRGLTSVEFCRVRPGTPSARRGGAAHPWLTTLVAQLQAYAAGRPVRFTVPLDLRAGTVFQRAVWKTLRKIPRGETRSYAWVARQIGNPKAVRAVGAACGANPLLLVVPCHRVVASDGSLGGFGAGLPLKRRLLALEAR